MSKLNKRRVATLLQRAPWTGRLALIAWRRLFQPWMTAGAIGAIYNDRGEMLFVEHVFHPKFPWGLPGGWMQADENPMVTVEREVFEETGLKIQVIKPLLIIQSPSVRRHLDMAYLCYAPPDAGEIRLSNELLAYRWCDPENLNEDLRLMRFHWMTVQAAIAERRQEQAHIPLSQ